MKKIWKISMSIFSAAVIVASAASCAGSAGSVDRQAAVLDAIMTRSSVQIRRADN